MIVDVSCVGEFFWAYLKKQEKIHIKKTICNTVRYTLTKIGTILLDHRSDQFKQTFKLLWRHSHVSKSFEIITGKVSEAES